MNEINRDVTPAPHLTPTLREALTKALDADYRHNFLSVDEFDELLDLRNAYPEEPWMPTEDGLAVHVDSRGLRSVYYVRDGKVNRFLRPDGTLYYPQEPSRSGTWEPCPTMAR